MFIRLKNGLVKEIKNGNYKNVIKEGRTIEDIIMPGDLIADSDGNKKICKETFFINGFYYWSIKPIKELYVWDSVGMYVQIAAYDNKKKKLVLL